ncbi:hypothetical protein MLD38_032129 [Melastoma candidum]|uniref:Uncharacterized protein n=1 Tax=Melastoma candidum TaxID=119954 RepID=A0ACB9M6W8_9MYRT|nr:hypothetical protein MLD38_032129 [Melastoma candidum]
MYAEDRVSPKSAGELSWEDWIDLVALAVTEPILFYDDNVLYQDELANNGFPVNCQSESHAKLLVSSPAILA